MRSLRTIKQPDLEQAILLLPFHLVGPLMVHLAAALGKGCEAELCARAAACLCDTHHAQLCGTAALEAEARALRDAVRAALDRDQKVVGENLAACRVMKMMQRGA